jgi:transcription initiation factor TFIIH subunit 1
MQTATSNVAYKKKDGTLAVSEDGKYLFWTPSSPPGASPAVTVPLADITNLQQTPATSPKALLKVVVGQENYTFGFTHATNARKDQGDITGILQDRIAALKASNVAALAAKAAPAPGVDDRAQPAAMAIAKAAASKAADESWYDDRTLLDDFALQKSLLDSNKALQDRLTQAIRDKPESVSVPQLTSLFWGARLNLLRAHAVERAQTQGEYNVLPEIKFVIKRAEKEGEPDTRQLNITKEQIKLIFKQYPVVAEAYNAHSPPLSAAEFWTRFFGSRLLKKLKGEKIMHYDNTDAILDKYLDRPDGAPVPTMQVPHFIDLEGNEANHSQQKGNRPDLDMRPSSIDKVPILRILNNLSQKMIAHVAPEEGEAHAPIGIDEEKFEELRLRDLALNDVDNRIRLNVRNERAVTGDADGLSADAKLYAQQDPQDVLSAVRAETQPSLLGADKSGILRLDTALGFLSDDEDDSEEESSMGQQTNGGAVKKAATTRVGSKHAIASASAAVFSSIKKHAQSAALDTTSLGGLEQATFDTLTMTHNTTTFFLNYFWTVFLSGDASRSAELAQLVITLDRSIDRINAVAEEAEAARTAKIALIEKQVKEIYKKTGKKRRVDYDTQAPPGRKIVDAMIRPTVLAVARATSAYRTALEEQSKETTVV